MTILSIKYCARNNHEKNIPWQLTNPSRIASYRKNGEWNSILDTVTRKCKVEQISKYIFKSF
jgi:23S rRNA pseudouridine2604 synthase